MTPPTRRPTRADVIAAYRSLLDRAPESEDVIVLHLAARSVEEVESTIRRSPEYQKRELEKLPFAYLSAFDAEATILRHENHARGPSPDHLTNYLGVRVSPRFFPGILEARGGQVEGVPIPSNWHADLAEWAAVLRAVELSDDSFVMAELGCGWGCWMNNAGTAAKRLGKAIHVVGIEADASHIAFAEEACRTNGFLPSEVTLHHGVAAASDGIALFPRQQVAGVDWGLEPILDAGDEERAQALATSAWDEVPMVSLDRIVGGRDHLDLLHIDIQGGEHDLIHDCLPFLGERVAYLVIGTHSRPIEGRLMSDLLAAGWRLEIERPAVLALDGVAPLVVIDGVQAWRNPALLPDGQDRRDPGPPGRWRRLRSRLGAKWRDSSSR
jgi:FkbM family methyltransferase